MTFVRVCNPLQENVKHNVPAASLSSVHLYNEDARHFVRQRIREHQAGNAARCHLLSTLSVSRVSSLSVSSRGVGGIECLGSCRSCRPQSITGGLGRCEKDVHSFPEG